MIVDFLGDLRFNALFGLGFATIGAWLRHAKLTPPLE